MKINENIKLSIKNHSFQEFPRECCGFIVEKEKEIISIPMINYSKNINNFIISPIDFLNVKSQYNILYIYHSHTDVNAIEFSNADINCAKHLMYNLIVYIINLNLFKIYNFISGKVENG